MAALTLLAGFLVAATTWYLWKLLNGFILRSPLDNIPGPPAKSLWKGSFLQLVDRHDWDFLENISTNYASVVRLHDLLGGRMLWVFDPKAIHHIIVKEQDTYELSRDRTTFRHMFFGPGLLGTVGDNHRRQRKLLNPVFSIANMRTLTPIFYNTIHRLREGMVKEIQTAGDATEVDMLSWMGRTALELVGQGGLGYSFDPLTESSHNEYGDSIKRLVPLSAQTGIWQLVFMFSHHLPLPSGINRFLADLVPNKVVQEIKACVDLAWKTATEIYQEKRQALLAHDEALKYQVGEGRDIMSILLRANMEAAVEDRLPEEEVIAQMSTLTFAGTDTTSNALARIFHVLSSRQDVQDTLRAEIIEARNGQDLSYDQLVELPYLDAVCKETMRLYPPFSFVAREAFRDGVLPLSEPIKGLDGTWMSEIVVPKGTRVNIGIHSCNRNKAIWGEDALEWKPERWLSPLPDGVAQAKVPGVYASLLTFLGGGRSCIGFKFSELEMKAVLSILLESFKFSPARSDICWNRGGIVYPSAGPHGRPSLPMRFERVKV